MTDNYACRQRILLEHRPGSVVTEDDFRIVRESVPRLERNQLLVRNTILSVDPFTRARLGAQDAYVSGLKIGDLVASPCVGIVEESTVTGVLAGSRVYHEGGWETISVVDVAEARVLDGYECPDRYHLGALGIPGFCAWLAVRHVLGVGPGDTVLIPSATGAVGTLAVQFAKNAGADHVIGGYYDPKHLGSLQGLGVHHALPSTKNALALAINKTSVSPNKIIDSVGGRQLESILSVARKGAIIATVGSMSSVVGEVPYGVRNLGSLISRSLTLRGFTLDTFSHLKKDFLEEVSLAIERGEIRQIDTVVTGFDRIIPAFISLFERGQHFGKLLVQVS